MRLCALRLIGDAALDLLHRREGDAAAVRADADAAVEFGSALYEAGCPVRRCECAHWSKAPYYLPSFD